MNEVYREIPIEDIFRIGLKALSHNLIVTPQRFPGYELYNCWNYWHDNRPTYVMLDRNVVTHLTDFAQGILVDDRKEKAFRYRILATYMAFFQLSNIMVEPNIATYEYASTVGSKTAKKELEMLFKVDNLPTTDFIDIALNRSNSIDIQSTLFGQNRQIHVEEDFEKRLNYWHFNYVCMKKAFLIWNQRGSPKDKMIEYMQWSWRDFLFGAPATFYVSLLLSSKFNGMLKVHKKDKSTVLKSIKNAAWDLTLIQYWVKKVQAEHETNERWYFMTFDNALREIAETLLLPEESETAVDKELSRIFRTHWGGKLYKEIFKSYNDLFSQQNSNDREVNRLENIKDRKEYFLNIEQNLDSEIQNILLGWNWLRA